MAAKQRRRGFGRPYSEGAIQMPGIHWKDVKKIESKGITRLRQGFGGRGRKTDVTVAG